MRWYFHFLDYSRFKKATIKYKDWNTENWIFQNARILNYTANLSAWNTWNFYLDLDSTPLKMKQSILPF